METGRKENVLVHQLSFPLADGGARLFRLRDDKFRKRQELLVKNVHRSSERQAVSFEEEVADSMHELIRGRERPVEETLAGDPQVGEQQTFVRVDGGGGVVEVHETGQDGRVDGVVFALFAGMRKGIPLDFSDRLVLERLEIDLRT